MAENQCSKISCSQLACGQRQSFLLKQQKQMLRAPSAGGPLSNQMNGTLVFVALQISFQPFRDLPPFCFYHLFNCSLHILSSDPAILSHRPTEGNYRGPNGEKMSDGSKRPVSQYRLGSRGVSLCVSLTFPWGKKGFICCIV